MEFATGLSMAEPTGGAAAAPAPAPASSTEHSSVLGYSEDVAAIFEARRKHAATRLDELKALLESWESPARSCPDEMLCRFLETNIIMKNNNRVVTGCNIKGAAKSLEATVKWRSAQGLDVNPHPLTLGGCTCCDVDPYGHCCFSIGVDRRGWMCTYMCPGRTTNRDPRLIERHMVLLLEQMFTESAQGPECRGGRALPTGQTGPPSHFVILLDLHGFSLSDMDPRVAMRVIPILLNHYPDRSAQVAILDSPWVFKAAWQLIKTVIDPLSQTKAIFLRGEEMHEYFNTFLTADQRAFATGMLALRAAPSRTAFVDAALCDRLRPSLGPQDAFAKETQELLCQPATSHGEPPKA